MSAPKEPETLSGDTVDKKAPKALQDPGQTKEYLDRVLDGEFEDEKGSFVVLANEAQPLVEAIISSADDPNSSNVDGMIVLESGREVINTGNLTDVDTSDEQVTPEGNERHVSYEPLNSSLDQPVTAEFPFFQVDSDGQDSLGDTLDYTKKVVGAETITYAEAAKVTYTTVSSPSGEISAAEQTEAPENTMEKAIEKAVNDLYQNFVLPLMIEARDLLKVDPRDTEMLIQEFQRGEAHDKMGLRAAKQDNDRSIDLYTFANMQASLQILRAKFIGLKEALEVTETKLEELSNDITATEDVAVQEAVRKKIESDIQSAQEIIKAIKALVPMQTPTMHRVLKMTALVLTAIPIIFSTAGKFIYGKYDGAVMPTLNFWAKKLGFDEISKPKWISATSSEPQSVSIKSAGPDGGPDPLAQKQDALNKAVDSGEYTGNDKADLDFYTWVRDAGENNKEGVVAAYVKYFEIVTKNHLTQEQLNARKGALDATDLYERAVNMVYLAVIDGSDKETPYKELRKYVFQKLGIIGQ